MQGLAQREAQGRRKNDGDRAVENGGRNFQNQRRGRGGGGKAADEQTVVGKGLEKVKDVIGKAAQRGGSRAAGAARRA